MIKNNIIYNRYNKFAFVVARAQGSLLWTDAGKRLVDFTCGWNTTNLGWNHPEVAEAMAEQVRGNCHAPMWTAAPVQVDYATALAGALPGELCAIGRATGGTEANEMAIKAARTFTGRRKIVGFRETYHGQSMATLPVGFPHEYLGPLAPPAGEYVQLAFPQTYRAADDPPRVLAEFAARLEEALAARDVAAVMTEAGIVTGWGSTYVAPDGYLRVVRDLTRRYGTLLILDEVGTGFSRCGRLFGMQLEGAVPDVATFAKAMSNGAAAIGALATTREIAEATCDRGLFISTFGWTPVACAAALRALQIHQRERLWEKASRDGDYARRRLRDELGDHPHVGDVRGLGLEIGVDLVKDRRTKEGDPERLARVTLGAFERGLHLAGDGQSTLQLMPPLTIEREALDAGLAALIESVKAS